MAKGPADTAKGTRRVRLVSTSKFPRGGSLTLPHHAYKFCNIIDLLLDAFSFCLLVKVCRGKQCSLPLPNVARTA